MSQTSEAYLIVMLRKYRGEALRDLRGGFGLHGGFDEVRREHIIMGMARDCAAWLDSADMPRLGPDSRVDIVMRAVCELRGNN